MKQSKRKGFYKRFPEYFVIITKKKDYWALRTSFNNMSEKNAVKKIFNSKKIIMCKEEPLKNILGKILSNAKIISVSGDFSKEDDEFSYSLSSKEKEINELIDDDFNFIFENEHNLEKINFIQFAKDNLNIPFKIFRHKFNVRHLKLVTTGLNPNEIENISEYLKKKHKIEEDIYLTKKEDRPLRLRYILNSNNVNGTNLFILKKDLDYLVSLGLIMIHPNKSFKLCMNGECLQNEDKTVFDIEVEDCPDCSVRLSKLGSSAKISRNIGKIREYITKAFKSNGLNYNGKIEKYFNSQKIKFLKFSNSESEELLVFLYEKGGLKRLVQKFTDRNLPVIAITMKQDIAKDLELKNYLVSKLTLTDIFLEFDKNNKLSLDSIIDDIGAKQLRGRSYNLVESLKLLRLFVSRNLDFNLLEGKSIQKKGNHFEKLLTHILKAISGAWFELGQTHQNKSVPDGLGYLKFGNKSFVYGFDAKLKGKSKYSRGLTALERRNQTKYINNLRKQAWSYGGLKSWLIVVKSESDYPKFKKSLEKLKTESRFKEIKLLSTEPLLKICEIYQKAEKEEVINKEIFQEFLYKLIKYKGDVTLEKVKKILSQMPQLQTLNIRI